MLFVLGGFSITAAACGSDSSSSGTSTSTHASSTTTTGATTSTVPDAVLSAPLRPLFPFATAGDARRWTAGYRSDGRGAWHLDAGATALAFARYLGYPEIDRVIKSRTDTDGAHVSVGFVVAESDHRSTAAIVHLVRYGTGPDVPWEVVGTDDTDFTLTEPAYGSTVSSPLVVGGVITGVDESITVRVHELGTEAPLGEQCCVAAGGVASPWSSTVNFAAPTQPVVVVSVSTGGHVQGVERFAATGVDALAG